MVGHLRVVEWPAESFRMLFGARLALRLDSQDSSGRGMRRDDIYAAIVRRAAMVHVPAILLQVATDGIDYAILGEHAILAEG